MQNSGAEVTPIDAWKLSHVVSTCMKTRGFQKESIKNRNRYHLKAGLKAAIPQTGNERESKGRTCVLLIEVIPGIIILTNHPSVAAIHCKIL